MEEQYPAFRTPIDQHLLDLQNTGAFSNEDLWELEDHLREEASYQEDKEKDALSAEQRAVHLLGPKKMMISQYRRKNRRLVFEEQFLTMISGMFFFTMLMPVWIFSTYTFYNFFYQMGWAENSVKLMAIGFIILVNSLMFFSQFSLFDYLGKNMQTFFGFLSKHFKVIGPISFVMPILLDLAYFLFRKGPKLGEFIMAIDSWMGVYFLSVFSMGIIALVNFFMDLKKGEGLKPHALGRFSFFVGGQLIWLAFSFTFSKLTLMLSLHLNLPSYFFILIYTCGIIPVILLWWYMFDRKVRKGKVMVC